MKGLLARLGHGSAALRVDPSTEVLSPGDSVEVRIEVEGGSTTRTAESLFAKVSATTTLRAPTVDPRVAASPTASSMALQAKATGIEGAVDPLLEYTVDVVEVADNVRIDPDERWTTTATVQVPQATPLTVGGTRVWIGGKVRALASRNAASERHYVDVVPDERFEALFDALDAMGMVYAGTKLTADPSAHTESSPVVESNHYVEHTLGLDVPYPFQTFRFVPRDRPHADALDVFEFAALATEDGLELDLDLDGLPDDARTVELEDPDADAIRERLEAAIDRLRHPA